MANPKYGSEKKGAPTNYYLTVAPSQIKVNCELNHVDVVLCCDPKAFTHTNPLEGLKKGGSLEAASQIALPPPFDQWLVGGMNRFAMNVRYMYKHLGGEIPGEG